MAAMDSDGQQALPQLSVQPVAYIPVQPQGRIEPVQNVHGIDLPIGLFFHPLKLALQRHQAYNRGHIRSKHDDHRGRERKNLPQ